MYFYGAHKCQVFFEFEINKNLSTVILNTRSEVEDYSSQASKYVEDFLRQSRLISWSLSIYIKIKIQTTNIIIFTFIFY